jgi:hypothetical protein
MRTGPTGDELAVGAGLTVRIAVELMVLVEPTVIVTLKSAPLVPIEVGGVV